MLALLWHRTQQAVLLARIPRARGLFFAPIARPERIPMRPGAQRAKRVICLMAFSQILVRLRAWLVRVAARGPAQRGPCSTPLAVFALLARRVHMPKADGLSVGRAL